MLCQRLCFQHKHDQKDHNNSAKDWLKRVRKNLENFPPFLQLPSPSCSQNWTVFTELWDFHINGLSEGLDVFIVKKVSGSTLIFSQLITSLQEVKLQRGSQFCGFLSFVPHKDKRRGLRMTEPWHWKWTV